MAPKHVRNRIHTLTSEVDVEHGSVEMVTILK
jgi:hypothetical protein